MCRQQACVVVVNYGAVQIQMQGSSCTDKTQNSVRPSDRRADTHADRVGAAARRVQIQPSPAQSKTGVRQRALGGSGDNCCRHRRRSASSEPAVNHREPVRRAARPPATHAVRESTSLSLSQRLDTADGNPPIRSADRLADEVGGVAQW